MTGAGRGIGREIALCLAQQGASVVVNDVGVSMDGRGSDEDPAAQTCKDIEAAGGRAVPSYDSVSDFAAAGGITQTAVDTFGRIDILVNNAGILRDRTLVKMSEDDFDAVVGVHLKGTFNCTRHAAELMRDAGYGRIVNITSSAGLRGNFGQTNYGAAKAGIAAFTIICGLELGRYNVMANAIAPVARTRMTENLGFGGAPEGGAWDALDPANISPLVVWLGSNDNDDVSGRVFLVDGDRISVAEGWRRGPTARNDKMRWEPSQLTKIIPDLVAKAETPSNMAS